MLTAAKNKTAIAGQPPTKHFTHALQNTQDGLAAEDRCDRGYYTQDSG